jgi:hypothetical protein
MGKRRQGVAGPDKILEFADLPVEVTVHSGKLIVAHGIGKMEIFRQKVDLFRKRRIRAAACYGF